MGLIFGPDAFTVGADTNINAYPGGGADYTYSNGSGNDLTVNATNDRVQPAPDQVNAIARLTDADYSGLGAQEARAVLTGSTDTGLGYVLLGCCTRGDTDADCYVGTLELGLTNEVIIYEVVGGTFTLLASADRGLANNIAYTMAFRSVGSAHTLIVNGETAVTATDATRAVGAPGIYGFGETGATGAAVRWLDDFEVDDLSTGIWLVGVGAQAASSAVGGSATAAYPTGYTATTNDFGLAIVVGRPEDTALVSAPSGWTEDTDARVLREVGANDLRIQVFWRIIQGGDSAPAFSLPATWDDTLAGMAVQMAVWRGVSTSTPLDATSVVSDAAAAATFTPTGIATATANAHVLSIVASADDNALRCSTAQNFTAWMGGASYDTTTGGDMAVGLASRQIVSPTTPTMPTWTQAAVGNDAWAAVAMALRPASTATPSSYPLPSRTISHLVMGGF